MRIYSFVILAIGILLSACHPTPHDITDVCRKPHIYPDYTDVTIPTDIAPLCFAMADDSVEAVDVTVTGSRGGSLHVNGEWADFDIDEWQQLVKQNKGGKLSVSVCALKDGQWTRYRAFDIYVSRQLLGEWGITYRRIPPSYEMYSKMGLYQRNLSTFEETPLIENTQTPGQCINCHTANGTNPDQYVFHIRGNHGATAVHHNGEIELLKAKNDTLGGSMVYPYWHPSGRYVAFSTNKTSQMFHTAKKGKPIEVYDSQSDVFVYDVAKHTLLLDTLTMRKYWAENTPAFSPDGRWLYFTTAQRQVYPTDYDKERYSLCRVAFDATTGRLGQEVDTLISTAATGKSATWPRPSYDGRYIMYTQTDYGYFSVWHPEADLWLLDLKTSERQPMTAVNSSRAESLHAWTTNSRWFLFTSRRDDGLYSRIYLSSINEKGQATKPFMLPQRNPKVYYKMMLDSYNTPDFTQRPVDTSSLQLQRAIMSDERTNTKALRQKADR